MLKYMVQNMSVSELRLISYYYGLGCSYGQQEFKSCWRHFL